MFNNQYIEEQRSLPTWGKLITDFGYIDKAVEEVQKCFQSRHRHNYSSVVGQNDIFDEYATLMNQSQLLAEDQCTENWYYDIFMHFLQNFGQTRHVVELGCFTGGSSRWLYVASRLFNFTLDIVDVNINYLAYARERIINTFGGIEDNVRFFHGDLPTYVSQLAIGENRENVTVHHDGPHTFNECLQDFASLNFIKDNLKHLIVQDTNLRSSKMDLYSFVDMAAYAVFGIDAPYKEIGKKLHVDSPVWGDKIYFDATEPEGKIFDFSVVKFKFPHPQVTASEFFDDLYKDQLAQALQRK